MFGLFKKFKDGFAKTFSAIGEKTRGLFGGRTIDAKKWQMAGDKKMELWYDSRDVLVKQRFAI